MKQQQQHQQPVQPLQLPPRQQRQQLQQQLRVIKSFVKNLSTFNEIYKALSVIKVPSNFKGTFFYNLISTCSKSSNL